MFATQAVKATIRGVSRTALFRAAVGVLEKRRAQTCDRLAVLTYHRVHPLEENTDLDPAVLSATPDVFRKQMEFLAENYRVLSMDECIGAAIERRFPPRAVVITFDDAYEDFRRYAWPILQSCGLPATMFVPTAFPDSTLPFWWDRMFAAMWATVDLRGAAELLQSRRVKAPTLLRLAKDRIKSLPHQQAMEFAEQLLTRLKDTGGRNTVLSWSELKQMAADGLTLAPHTRRHPILPQLPLDEAIKEVSDSWTELREHVGSTNVRPVFAYPSGAHTVELAGRLSETDMVAAFTTRRCVNKAASLDPMRLSRINVGVRTPLGLLRAQLVR